LVWRILELRAVYLQSTDLKTNFGKYGINGFLITYNSRDINLTRWGGEFKANIGVGNLNPCYWNRSPKHRN
jgi:hypothetical protein